MPSKMPSPYSSPWSNTDTLASVRSWYVPSIQTMGGISPLVRVGDDLVQHRAGEILVPGDGGALRDHLHAGGVLAFHLERDVDLPVARRALDFPLLPIILLLGLRFRLPDFERAKGLVGGGRRTLDGDGDDRLDPALGKVDTPPGASTGGGDHAATEQERRTAGGRLGPQGRTRSSHAILRSRLAACPTVSCANIPGSGTPRLPGPRWYACYPDHRLSGPKLQNSTPWNRYSGGRGCGSRQSARTKAKHRCATALGIPSWVVA